MRAHGPDFLGIGAQRAGSTWLHRHLARHPDLFLPFKEVHYFNQCEDTSPNRSQDAERPKERGLERRHRTLRSALQQGVPASPRFLLGQWDDDWYRSLFRQAGSRLAGEITPAYATLSERTVRRIWRMNPGLKVLFVVRDPIDRVWSQARLDAARGRLDIASVDECLAFVHRPGVRHRTEYSETIARWTRIFGSDQVLVGFFSDLTAKPAAFLRRVFDFLGVAPIATPSDVAVPVNGADVHPIDDRVAAEIATVYLDEIREMARRFPRAAAPWLARADLLAGSLKPLRSP